MNNISKKTIFFGLGLLFISVFGVTIFVPTEVEAYKFIRMGTGEVKEFNYDYTNKSNSKKLVSSPSKSNYTNSTENKTSDNSSSSNVNKNSNNNTVTRTIEKTDLNKTGENNNSEDEVSVNSDINKGYGNLTANALFGSNSFMPTGLAQWIILIAIIIAIIFLWRYVFGEEKYMSEPLKHA